MSTAEAITPYGKGSHPFSAHSPVTGQTYTMTRTPVGMPGRKHALVYLRCRQPS